MFYIETRNTPLEEIVRHFDGEAAVLGGAAATEKGRKLANELGLEDEVGAAERNANHRGEVEEEKDPVVRQKELGA